MAQKLNGRWYSTRSEGQCVGQQKVGVDCWWRELAVQRTINATCLTNSLKHDITANYPACFQACPQPQNATSDCWIECMLKSINGDPAPAAGIEAPAPLSRAALLGAFTKPFLPTSQGGCPELGTASIR